MTPCEFCGTSEGLHSPKCPKFPTPSALRVAEEIGISDQRALRKLRRSRRITEAKKAISAARQHFGRLPVVGDPTAVNAQALLQEVVVALEAVIGVLGDQDPS
jgi:hypothetical protein